MIYRAEKDACRAFPDPRDAGLAAGTKRNFQVLSALEFLAEFTQHIPPKGAHLIRYYGWYSNKSRGMRRKAARPRTLAPPALPRSPRRRRGRIRPGRCSSSGCTRSIRWPARSAAATMEVIAFIEPPQGSVIERILRHCGLWRERRRRAARPGTCRRRGLGCRDWRRARTRARPEVARADLRGRGHVLGDVLNFPTGVCVDGARVGRESGVICGPVSGGQAPTRGLGMGHLGERG